MHSQFSYVVGRDVGRAGRRRAREQRSSGASERKPAAGSQQRRWRVAALQVMPARGRFKQPLPVHPVRDREGTYYAGEEPYQSQAWYERLVSAQALLHVLRFCASGCT